MNVGQSAQPRVCPAPLLIVGWHFCPTIDLVLTQNYVIHFDPNKMNVGQSARTYEFCPAPLLIVGWALLPNDDLVLTQNYVIHFDPNKMNVAAKCPT